MTKSDAYFYRLAMPKPFATGSGATITPIEADGSQNKVNFEDGFPSPYSAPASNNGKFVTRGEMNAIGNLASQNQFYFLAGGINTFDSEFATQIGGYPKDAILKYLNNNYLYDVVSLVDNNMVNFNEVGVDGENWQYLSVAEKKVFDDVFFEGGTGVTTGDAILGIVKSKRNSGIILETSLSPVIGVDKSTYDYSIPGIRQRSGCGILINELGTTIPETINSPSWTVSGNTATPNWQGWKSLSGDFALMQNNSGTATVASQTYAGSFTNVRKDYYYAIGLFCAEGHLETDNQNHLWILHLYTSISGTLKLLYAS